MFSLPEKKKKNCYYDDYFPHPHQFWNGIKRLQSRTYFHLQLSWCATTGCSFCLPVETICCSESRMILGVCCRISVLVPFRHSSEPGAREYLSLGNSPPLFHEGKILFSHKGDRYSWDRSSGARMGQTLNYFAQAVCLWQFQKRALRLLVLLVSVLLQADNVFGCITFVSPLALSFSAS